MVGGNESVRVARRCLVHPASVAAMFVLFLNDHWWKAAMPGAVTVKISDFAGLFFAPFLIMWGVGAVVPSVTRAGALAFALTGLWFAAIKSTPLAAVFTEDLVASLVGRSQIACDPTDLVALVVLVPAWRVLGRERVRGSSHIGSRWHGVAVAGAAALCLATSRPARVFIDQVTEVDGAAYVHSTTKIGIGPQPSVFTSTDLAQWAEHAQEIGFQDPPRFEAEGGENRCIRVRTSPRMVEQSLDCGGTWTTVWQRIPSRVRLRMAMGPRPDGRPMDVLALASRPGAFVVAMGGEGVLVSARPGEWRSVGIGNAQPSSDFAEPDDLLVLFILWQWIHGLGLGVVAWTTLSVGVWLILMRRIGQPAGIRSVLAPVRPYLILYGWCFAVSVLTGALVGSREIAHASLAFGVPGWLIAGLLVYTLRAPWSRIVKAPEFRAQPIRVVVTVLAVLVALLSQLSIFAWDLGFIEDHGVALAIPWTALAVSLLGLILWTSLRPMPQKESASFDPTPYREEPNQRDSGS